MVVNVFDGFADFVFGGEVPKRVCVGGFKDFAAGFFVGGFGDEVVVFGVLVSGLEAVGGG